MMYLIGGDWSDDEFFMPRPCMLKYDGTVDYYLDPNDYTKKEDGTASDVGDISYNGNAMMEWGRDGNKIWYKLVADSDDTSYSVYISNEQADDGYVCWNFYDCNNHVCNHFYTAIYTGKDINSRMRSISGVSPRLDVGTNDVSYAKANNTAGGLTGNMWNIETYGDRMLINYLLVLLGKSLYTQSVYGNGYYTSSSTNNTGTMNNKGMFFGNTTSQKTCVKVFGMEDWWGNVNRKITGLLNNGSYYFYKLTPNTADGSTVSSYSTSYNGMINSRVTVGSASYGRGFIKKFKVVGDTIIPDSVGGTKSTYYCGYLAPNTSDYPTSGYYYGWGGDDVNCSPFGIEFIDLDSWGSGCALSFRGE